VEPCGRTLLEPLRCKSLVQYKAIIDKYRQVYADGHILDAGSMCWRVLVPRISLSAKLQWYTNNYRIDGKLVSMIVGYFTNVSINKFSSGAGGVE
jgi:hypothetical protein